MMNDKQTCFITSQIWLVGSIVINTISSHWSGIACFIVAVVYIILYFFGGEQK